MTQAESDAVDAKVRQEIATPSRFWPTPQPFRGGGRAAVV